MGKIKIAIAGIGGVGGFFGGKLAAQFYNSAGIDVCFIARGANETAIKTKGLKLVTANDEQIIHPAMVTSNAVELGKVDYLICCTKSYGLEEMIKQLNPCITNKTVILPLLNGVDSCERIKKILPINEIWDGCVYLIARLIEPGLVKETGSTSSIFFGAANATKEKLSFLETSFKTAGIDANAVENIEQIIWKKFAFISTIATLTSYLDKPIGAILKNETDKQLLHKLLNELVSVAEKKQKLLPVNITAEIIDRLVSLPYEATSSMHSDFKKGGKTELESLTGYVVRAGKELNTPTPTYNLMYAALLSKNLS